MSWPAPLEREENVGVEIARNCRGNRCKKASVSGENGYGDLSVTPDSAGRHRPR
jgi:hypothetical protein